MSCFFVFEVRNDIFTQNFEIIIHFTQYITFQLSPESGQVL